MSLRIEYHDLVDLDLVDAWTWYEDQEDGLGDRFLVAVNATVVRASRWPSAGSPVLRNDKGEVIERKVATNGFPHRRSIPSTRQPVGGDSGTAPTPPSRPRHRPSALML